MRKKSDKTEGVVDMAPTSPATRSRGGGGNDGRGGVQKVLMALQKDIGRAENLPSLATHISIEETVRLRVLAAKLHDVAEKVSVALTEAHEHAQRQAPASAGTAASTSSPSGSL